MADGRASISVPDGALGGPGAAHSARIAVPGGNGAAGVLLPEGALEGPGAAHAARIDVTRALYYIVEAVAAGTAELMDFHSDDYVSGDVTAYLGGGHWDLQEAEAEIAVAAGTASILVVSASVAPTPGTFVYTLRRDGADTGLTVTLTGSETEKAITTNVSYTQLQKMSLKLVRSGSAPKAKHGAALKFTPS